MTAIYAIIPAAHAPDLNRAFEAMGYGPETFSVPLTSASPALSSSPETHFHMYNAGADPADFSIYAAAKVGVIPPNDLNGDPVAWGQGGAINAADALAAFAHLELWANESAVSPVEFAEMQRGALGLSLIPVDW